MNGTSFLAPFVQRIAQALPQRQEGNRDNLRFPPARGIRPWLKDRIKQLAAGCGFVRVSDAIDFIACDRLEFFLAHHEELSSIYEGFADDASRHLLMDILAFRVLGYRRVRLPTNNTQYWEARQKLNGPILKQRRTFSAPGESLGYLNRYDLRGCGFPIELDAHPLNILCTYLLHQYRYSGPPCVGVKPGDVVVDGGGCWGDSALYFANAAGEHGKVICFEFLAENLNVLRTNLQRNPTLAARISVVERALWDRSGERLSIAAHGPGTHVDPQIPANGCGVPTLAIDDLRGVADVDRVDLIKLDIEGAELAALRGAEQTLRRFKPTLAVALYHRDEDFISIPRYLQELDLGYQFFLGHYTIHAEETILFARATRPSVMHQTT